MSFVQKNLWVWAWVAILTSLWVLMDQGAWALPRDPAPLPPTESSRPAPLMPALR